MCTGVGLLSCPLGSRPVKRLHLTAPRNNTKRCPHLQRLWASHREPDRSAGAAVVPPLPYSMEELQPKQDLQAERPLKRHIIIMVWS